MNWLRNLLRRLMGRDGTGTYRQLWLARLREVEKWEADSPTSIWTLHTQRRWRKHWTFLDIYSQKDSHRIPNWLRQAARRINVQNRGPRFYHTTFVTYKVEYDGEDGLLIFRGIKPSRLVKIESELRKRRR